MNRIYTLYATIFFSLCALADNHIELEVESPAAADSEMLEEVITIGTRRKSQTTSDAIVPIDFYSAESIQSVSSSDLLDALGDNVPSLDVNRFPIADGASIIRPMNLRSLDSHHTLVLLNNKRRHRSSVMRMGGFGSHGVDFSSIPATALKNVEVLRDGAAAQYGSDAIAGVINFNLADDNSGVEGSVRYSKYSWGDGAELTLEGKSGFTVGSGGFLTLVGQYSDSEPTNRSEPYDIPIGSSGMTPLEATRSELTVDGVTYYGPDAHTYTYDSDGNIVQVIRGSDGVPDDLNRRFAENYSTIGGGRAFSTPEQIWGKPWREQISLVLNNEFPLSDGYVFYNTATYSARNQGVGFFYRRPGVPQLFPVRLQDGSIYDPRAELYPSGFTPQFSGHVLDMSIYSGMRNFSNDQFTSDASVSYGRNEVRYRIENTLNPSLGPASPTAFRPGDLINEELALNIDITWTTTVANSIETHFAVGGEARRDTYSIVAGEPSSYAVGPFGRSDPFNFEITQVEVDLDPTDALTVIACRIPGHERVGELCRDGDPINTTVPIGSNGFPGYPPAFSTSNSRDNIAIYGESEFDLSSSWHANVATRVERYSDFGTVAIWKVASKYEFTPSTAVRGSFHTGFRAPTVGQIFTANVRTAIGPDGQPRAEGIFPSTHGASRIFGSSPLESEDARSVAAGLVFELENNLNWSIDLYRIFLEDRIVLSSTFSVQDTHRMQLEALGVPGAGEIAVVRFFTNDVDTVTSGIDLVAGWSDDWAGGRTRLSGNINFNNTNISKRGRFIGGETEFDLENGIPKWKAIVTGTHTYQNWDLLVRLRAYGSYENTLNSSLSNIQSFDPEFVLDASYTYQFGSSFALKFGVENLLDRFPPEALVEGCCGQIYRGDSLIGWQGRLVYLETSWSR